MAYKIVSKNLFLRCLWLKCYVINELLIRMYMRAIICIVYKSNLFSYWIEYLVKYTLVKFVGWRKYTMAEDCFEDANALVVNKRLLYSKHVGSLISFACTNSVLCTCYWITECILKSHFHPLSIRIRLL